MPRGHGSTLNCFFFMIMKLKTVGLSLDRASKDQKLPRSRDRAHDFFEKMGPNVNVNVIKR